MYKASTELINILLNNGFKNKSYVYVRLNDDRFSCKEPYNPFVYKRMFGIGKGKRRLNFFFDYINMAVIDGGGNITKEYYELNESQLRSIIAYFKLSYQRRLTLKIYTNYQIESAGHLMEEQRKYGYAGIPFDIEFEKIYNSIKI